MLAKQKLFSPQTVIEFLSEDKGLVRAAQLVGNNIGQWLFDLFNKLC